MNQYASSNVTLPNFQDSMLPLGLFVEHLCYLTGLK
jgi:hypothetical protein